jgi:tRNA1Val (adenine37-N6)-methyltransferase
MVTTEGHLLGGRIRYRQPDTGFRSGLEPVLLAASVPARPGEHVLEAGTGAGAALLCLMLRIPGISATGVEAEAAMAALAVANATANGFSRIDILAERIETVLLTRHFDHAIANPPYHQPDGSRSPQAARERAKRGSEALLQGWIERLGSALRRRGSLTLIVPSGLVPTCLEAMARFRCPCTTIFPLWPMAGRPAKLVLIRGVKEARARMRLMPGLVLHQQDGTFTPATQAILSDAAALDLDHAGGRR